MALGLSALQFRLKRLSRRSWVKVTGFAVLGVASAVGGYFFKGLIPSDLSAQMGAESVDAILQVLASSMLAVTTFSLSILTAAYANASGSATPRAVALLVEDGTSQTVLATFLGAFVFSLVSIILLQTGVYGLNGRVILFGVTLAVVAIVIIALLRWIDEMGRLGLMGDTIRRASDAAESSLCARLQDPWLGGRQMIGAPPAGAVPVCAPIVGYVQHLDAAQLNAIAAANDAQLYLAAQPGDVVHPAQPLLHASRLPNDPDEAARMAEALRRCFTIGAARDFEQDPRFGMSVLSQIAQRALSPAVNDPATAIQVIHQMLGILANWTEDARPDARHDRLWVPPLRAGDLLETGLLPIARDGAAHYEVSVEVLGTLLALGRIAPAVFAKTIAQLADITCDYAGDSQIVAAHLQDLARLNGQIHDLATTKAA